MPPMRIGAPPWTRDEMTAELPVFAKIYADRPIQDNFGGMSSSHLFLFWFLLKKLAPKHVIESGVYKGQGTWFIEQAVPDAMITCLDVDWSNLAYRSGKARYLTGDFATHNWSGIDWDSSLAFFDDHVNAVRRTKQCASIGVKHLIFEDNYYPDSVSDVYSLKNAFAGIGHQPRRGRHYWLQRIKGMRNDVRVKPNESDAEYLRSVIDIYHELPPPCLPRISRWGTPYADLPVEIPLLTAIEEGWQQIFADEGKWYTWLAYVRLK